MSQQHDPRGPGDQPRPGDPDDRFPPDEGTMIIEPEDRFPSDEGTMIIEPGAAPGGSPAPPGPVPPPGPATGHCPNPACRQPVGPDVRFCQACGTALAQGERPRPWLIVVGVVWLIIAAGAYVVLYSNAFVIGRP